MEDFLILVLVGLIAALSWTALWGLGYFAWFGLTPDVFLAARIAAGTFTALVIVFALSAMDGM